MGKGPGTAASVSAPGADVEEGHACWDIEGEGGLGSGLDVPVAHVCVVPAAAAGAELETSCGSSCRVGGDCCAGARALGAASTPPAERLSRCKGGDAGLHGGWHTLGRETDAGAGAGQEAPGLHLTGETTGSGLARDSMSEVRTRAACEIEAVLSSCMGCISTH